MSDITFSDGSTFEKGFNPPPETLQAQAGTDRLNTEISNGEEARTRQRQVEAAQSSEEEDNPTGEELCMAMMNPAASEEEINFAIPTLGGMTQDDSEENEEKRKEEEEEVQPQQEEDPTQKLGGNPLTAYWAGT